MGMKNIAIIGAGMSGLAIANLLQEKNYNVTVFEKDAKPGGLIKCDVVNGCLFHCTGGHVFNTKRQDVLDWFWLHFNKEQEFAKALRNSSVAMPDGKMVPYPIENHVYLLNDETLKLFIDDLISITKNKMASPSNFEDFLRGQFGETLYNLYFQPYNYKVWRRDLTKIPLSWLEGKLPMPSVAEMIYNNIRRVEERAFVHSSFFYAKKGGSQFLADRLAEKLSIRYNAKIECVRKQNEKWLIDNEEFDKIIFCGNIKQTPLLFSESLDISSFIKPIENLESHGTTAVFCEIENNPYSWIYMPSREYESHRIICTGNFSPSNNVSGKMTATIEFTDEISKENILQNLAKIPFSPKYLAHHYEKYTYPIQDISTREMITKLKEVTEKQGVFLLGRFAEWEYYNMDAAIGAAMDLCNAKF